MPIGRYVTWVGTLLLALLFVVDWLVPKSAPDADSRTIDKPVIRIASIQQLPERIVIDTNQPTIVPPPMLAGDRAQGQSTPTPQQSYASATPPPTPIDVDKKERKAVKRQGPKVAAKQPSLPSTRSVPDGVSSTTVPLTKLSFADIISGQLVRSLLNLR